MIFLNSARPRSGLCRSLGVEGSRVTRAARASGLSLVRCNRHHLLYSLVLSASSCIRTRADVRELDQPLKTIFARNPIISYSVLVTRPLPTVKPLGLIQAIALQL